MSWQEWDTVSRYVLSISCFVSSGILLGWLRIFPSVAKPHIIFNAFWSLLAGAGMLSIAVGGSLGTDGVQVELLNTAWTVLVIGWTSLVLRFVSLRKQITRTRESGG